MKKKYDTKELVDKIPLKRYFVLASKVMQTTEECLLSYRSTLRSLLNEFGVASNPAVDDDWILGQVSQLVRNGNRAIRVRTSWAITEELRNAVKEFFAHNVYKGYIQPFQLRDIAPSPHNLNILYAIPDGIDEEIGGDQDRDWEKRLAALGKQFNVHLCLPHWCYGK